MSTVNFADELLNSLNIPYKGIDGMMKLLELKEEDVPENKREILRLTKPVIKEFLKEWVNQYNNQP